jgi:hypothetical protein
MNNSRVCFCVTGWHFHENVYTGLVSIPDTTLFVISHKQPQEVPTFVKDLVLPSHLLFYPNRGYDWGCYQQFIESQKWLDFDVVVFLHDDLIIKSLEFLPLVIDKLAKGKVVGNGRNGTKTNWPQTHIFSYAHAIWKPPSWDFTHETVRGSFFAIRSQSLQKIGSFEVLWDHHGWFGVGAGNWSLRATCGKMQHVLGADAFQFLTDDYLVSPYIEELERGGQSDSSVTTGYTLYGLRYRFIYWFSEYMMTRYMNGNNPRNRAKWASWMQSFYSWI